MHDLRQGVAGEDMEAVVSDRELRMGHRDRLRRRFESEPSSLTDAEVLELALGYAYVRRDNSLLAKRLLHERGGLCAVMASSLAELEQVEGCGAPAERLFRLMRELEARCAQEQTGQAGALSLSEIAAMGKSRLGDCRQEELWGVLLDRQNRMLAFKKIRHGTADKVSIEPIEVVELMIRFHASSIVLMHNHPGGSAEPSAEDRAITAKTASALSAIGLHMHDHLIIAGQKCRCIMKGILL